MERAVQGYLQAHRSFGYRPKALEWRQTAPGHLQVYVQAECHLLLVHQVSEATIGSFEESNVSTKPDGNMFHTVN